MCTCGIRLSREWASLHMAEEQLSLAQRLDGVGRVATKGGAQRDAAASVANATADEMTTATTASLVLRLRERLVELVEGQLHVAGRLGVQVRDPRE